MLTKQLEKVQNQIIKTIQGFLPGTSGTACRGLLGIWDIKAEIDKRKLYLLGRIIRSSDRRAHKRIFKRRFIRWKWNFDKKMTGFIPDIMAVLRHYNITTFC